MNQYEYFSELWKENNPRESPDRDNTAEPLDDRIPTFELSKPVVKGIGDTPKFSLPAKAYYNTCFHGILPCVVLEVKKDNKDMPDCTTAAKLKIRITAKKNLAYRYGEIIETSGCDVFPRSSYHRTGIFTFIVTDYAWKS